MQKSTVDCLRVLHPDQQMKLEKQFKVCNIIRSPDIDLLVHAVQLVSRLSEAGSTQHKRPNAKRTVAYSRKLRPLQIPITKVLLSTYTTEIKTSFSRSNESGIQRVGLLEFPVAEAFDTV
ncbi:hypothetical protein Zmor_011651 [Zophobas morio]|uniref:Uncharacterized protein n=1 Tax=Zophobas morio TaxID=2755281 RepID=A0AA38ML58_9CUCU|nr:hypothetical protein Zmor_011651 [Zophobas morio]